MLPGPPITSTMLMKPTPSSAAILRWATANRCRPFMGCSPPDERCTRSDTLAMRMLDSG